jgi:DNA-binding NarL/FixJ family response regulator
MPRNNSMLFMIDTRSKFSTKAKNLEIFSTVDFATNKDEVLELFEKNKYDIVLSDLSVEAEQAGVLKQLKDMDNDQIIFAILDPKDRVKLYGIADMGINAFELLPTQFNQALEMIAEFDPEINYQ